VKSRPVERVRSGKRKGCDDYALADGWLFSRECLLVGGVSSGKPRWIRKIGRALRLQTTPKKGRR
jgi:hypothetical protein